MHRRHALGLFAGFALCPLCVSAAFGEENHAGTHWSYEEQLALTSGAVSTQRTACAQPGHSNRPLTRRTN